jgi:hypothetical protein
MGSPALVSDLPCLQILAYNPDTNTTSTRVARFDFQVSPPA